MGELSEDAATLLRSGRDSFRPGGADRARVLEALRKSLGDAAVSGGVGGAAQVDASAALRAAAWKSPWVKALGAVSVLAVGAGITIHPWPWTPARPLQHAAVAQPQLTEAAPSPSTGPPLAPDLTAGPPSPADAPALPMAAEPLLSAPANRARAHPSTRVSADSLAEEVRILSTAERQLNEGSRESALATLADHERRFPHGALTEARMAVRVEALCGLGRMAEARADLLKLALAYPASPHLDAARRLCGADVESQ